LLRFSGQIRIQDQRSTPSTERRPEEVPRRSRPSYPPEFRAEAVRLYRSSPEGSIPQIAQEIGVSDQSLRNWVKQAQIVEGEREGLTTEEREELRRLRRENRILKKETKILDKRRLLRQGG
jgi:transposase